MTSPDGAISNLPERRRDVRIQAAGRFCSIETSSGRQICFLRNIAPGGIMVRCMKPVQTGEEILVDFEQGDRIDASVSWTQGALAGITFVRRVDVQAVLSAPARRGSERRRDRRRFDIRCAATVETDGQVFPAYTRDLSESGVKLCIKQPLRLGRAVVTLFGFRPLEATVRWCDDGQAGLCFTKPIASTELAKWMEKRLDLVSRSSKLHPLFQNHPFRSG